jgi:tetratricopeptide (TPR) repeat protein
MFSVNSDQQNSLAPRGKGAKLGTSGSFPWPWAVLFLLAVLPYLGVLRNDFACAYDDKAQILDNPYVHNFHHLWEVLTTPVWAHLAAQPLSPYYRPVSHLVFLVCFQLFGPSAFGFHLSSLLLNAAVVGVVFVLAKQLFGDGVPALAAAGLFALHPVHVEVVAWISAMMDLELTLFYLLTFWFFMRSVDDAGRLRRGAQVAMCASYALALLSKEPAVTLPLLALIYEHFYRGDRGETTWGQKLRRYAPLWLVCLGYTLLRTWVMGTFVHPPGINLLSTPEVVLSAVALVGEYIAVLFWPVHLSAFYPFQASTSLLDWRVLGGAMALVLLAGAFVVLWKRARPASFGILWLFVALFPVLNARWLGAYVLADRYFYLPSAGFCLVAGWASAALWRLSSRQPIWRTALVAAGSMVAVLCVLRISTRVLDWQNDVAILTRSLAAAPHDYRLHDALGQAYWFQGEHDKAEQEWRETLHLEPNNVQTLFLLGGLYAQQKRFDLAVPLLERSILLRPKNANAHLDLGGAYAELGKMDRAEEQFKAAVLLAPLNFNAHNLLGKLYFDSKRFSEAEQQFRQSLECEPNLAAYDHLGYIYMQRKDPDAAEKAFNAALALNGTDSHAHYNLGRIYAAAGRNAQAAEELRKALAADPNNPEILSALEKLPH